MAQGLAIVPAVLGELLSQFLLDVPTAMRVDEISTDARLADRAPVHSCCRFEALPARDPVHTCASAPLAGSATPTFCPATTRWWQHAVQRQPAQAPLLCDQPAGRAAAAFFWTIAKPGQEPVPTAIDEWTESTVRRLPGRPTGRTVVLLLREPDRVPSRCTSTRSVSVPVAPLAGLPVYAVLDLFVDIEHDRFWWWHGAALTASLLTALAALFVFLAARGFVEPVLIALCAAGRARVWPGKRCCVAGRPLARRCGSIRCAASACVDLSLRRLRARRTAFLLFLTARPHCHLVRLRAERGSAASRFRRRGPLWQSSWWESLPGLLFSPARGLVWFSPVLVLGLVSAAACAEPALPSPDPGATVS